MPEKIFLVMGRKSRYAHETKDFLKRVLGENRVVFAIRSKNVRTPELIVGNKKHFGLREIKRAVKELERR